MKKLPVQWKKRRIVLERQAEVFEPGRAFPEGEVNRILTTFDDDYCTLRRLLVDEGLLDRHHLENPPAVGIFQFRNLESGKLFIGSSMNLPGAFTGTSSNSNWGFTAIASFRPT